MSENFNLEIIGPENTVLKTEVKQVTIPSFEGLMSVLKDHISLVTFLRPGLVEVRNDKGDEIFFVEDGTVELNNNNLLILSSTAKNIKELSKDDMDKMIKDSEEKIKDEKIIDKEKYVLYYKINTLKEIRQ
mgnify:CR=1 FL=1|tara:strand:+ start:146 stop:538 length:393 start_codon:yes stop_codon:yes gene_type:complete